MNANIKKKPGAFNSKEVIHEGDLGKLLKKQNIVQYSQTFVDGFIKKRKVDRLRIKSARSTSSKRSKSGKKHKKTPNTQKAINPKKLKNVR